MAQSTQRLPIEFIHDLLSRIDLVDIISIHLPVKKQGQNFVGHCPFHDEKTPSFTISPQKQFYHCFGCRAHGNAINFLMEFERLTFIESIEKLANRAGVEIPKSSSPKTKQFKIILDILETANVFYRNQLKNHEVSKEAISYLKNRGISGKTAKIFQLGFSPPDWRSFSDYAIKKDFTPDELSKAGLIIQSSNQRFYDRFRNRIIFPIRNPQGYTIGFGGRSINQENPKYLNSPDTPTFHKGQALYGIFEALQSEKYLSEIFVVEGYLDVLQLVENKITNVVATLGTATTDKHINLLLRYTKKLIFCFDGDIAGRQAAKRALVNCLPIYAADIEIFFMFLPPNEDPDSLIRKIGKESFLKQANEATPFEKFFFHWMAEGLDLTQTQGRAKFISTSLPLINSIQDNTMKLLMYEKLSKLTHLDITSLNPSYKKSIASSTHSKTILKKSISKVRSASHLLQALLIQNPELANLIQPEDLYKYQSHPDGKLLIELVSLLHQHPSLTMSSLVEYWRDKPEFNHISLLAQWDTGILKPSLRETATGLLHKIEQQASKSTIERILNKGNLENLNDKERAELTKLIRQHKGLID